MSPGAAVCGKAGLKPGTRLLDGTLQRWGAKPQPPPSRGFSGRRQGRAGPCCSSSWLPQGPLHSFRRPALPAAGSASPACCLHSPDAHHAAWFMHPMPLGSGQKWIQTWMFCSCYGTSVYHRALSLQGIMLRVLINTSLINTNGRERPGQYGDTFLHCLSGEVQMLHRRGFRILFLLK